MEIKKNTFKAGLKSLSPLCGSWIMTGNPNAAEAMGCAGLDFIIIDMEHTDARLPEVSAMLRALGATPTQGVVRLPSDDSTLIHQVLDVGARSIMVPFINTAEQATAVVSASTYPPNGTRGFALMHRGSHYGQAANYLDRIKDEICIVAQIETQEAIENLESIAAVDGIDGLFFGPGDLSAVAGTLGRTTSDEVKSLLAKAAESCRKCAIASGTLAPNMEAGIWAKKQGYNFISVTNDLGMIVNGSKAIADALKE
ncbi:MAG: 2-dehydro-3-deoxyglucarate aldolase [Rhodospirillales bacterium]|nr:2-dehydro-3-deoxyglucarate aldolase [Rhodospirillales bacterium]